MVAYGKPIPETYLNIFHIGNGKASHPGADLLPDVMNGWPKNGRLRYLVSRYDVAILGDLGLPVPGTPAAQSVCDSPKETHHALRPRPDRASVILGPQPFLIE